MAWKIKTDLRTFIPMKVSIYHNPRCQKSRCALKHLQEIGAEITVRLYLEHPLSRDELKVLQGHLDLPVNEWIRTQDKEYKNMIKGRNFSESEMLDLLVQQPKLMQRPIVKFGKRAVVARDIEALTSFNLE